MGGGVIATPSKRSHDIVLTDGTTTLGLKLARDRNGLPILSRNYAPSLANQRFESMSDAAFRPEQEVLVSQKEWAAGFGRQEEEAKRYMQAFGTDASYAGAIIPGPVIVAASSTSFGTETLAGSNLSFETWTVATLPDDWIKVGTCTLSEETSSPAPDDGSSCLQCDIGEASADVGVEQRFTHGPSVENVQITITAKYYHPAAETVNSVKLEVFDGATSLGSDTDTPPTDDSWTTLTVQVTPASGESPDIIVKLTAFDNATSETIYFDTVVTAAVTEVTPSTLGNPAAMADYSNKIYLGTANGLFEWDEGNTRWDFLEGAPRYIEDLEVMTVSSTTYLFIACGLDKSYWYWDGTTFTKSSRAAPDDKVGLFRLVSTKMYKTETASAISSTTSPINGGAAWGAPASVGDTNFNITALVNHLELLYISKENQVYQLDSSDNLIEILTQIRSMFNTNTGKNTISWNGILYVPAESQELMEYNAGAVLAVGPNRFAERLSDFGGQVVATAGDGSWLYLILDNSTKIEIMKGRRQTVPGAAVSSEFRWHPFVEDTYTTVSGAHLSTIEAKRLWYWGGSTAPSYIPLSTQYADPLSDSNLTFLTGETHETTWYELGTSRADKTLGSFLLQSDSLTGSAQTVTVEYKKWGDSDWTEVGGSGNGTYNTSPDQEKFFQTGTSAPKTKKVQFRFTLTTTSSSTGLAVLGFTCYAILNPLRLEMIRAVVEVSDGNSLLSTGGDDDMTYSKVASQLHTWADTHPLTLTIPDGTPDGLDFTVKFAETFPNEQFHELGTFDPPHSPRSQMELVFIAQRTS